MADRCACSGLAIDVLSAFNPFVTPRLVSILLSMLVLAWPLLDASGWPQFRGPRASGVDATRPLAVRWNVETGDLVRWKSAVPGLAHASPIVWGDRIYLATAVGPGQADLKVGLYGNIDSANDQEVHQWRLLALDLATGTVVWNALGHEGIPKVRRHTKASHCNSTPATDGEHIVALFGSEGLFCFRRDGALQWKVDLGPMDSGYFQVPSAQWGFASSPVLHDGKVVVLCDVQTNSFLAAFALADGRELWRTPRHDVPTWGSPTVVEATGRTQIAVNGWHHSGGYAFDTGQELWRLKGGGDIPVPTPVFAHGLIYLSSAHGGPRPIRAIRPEATGDITPPELSSTNAAIAWVHPRLGTYMQTPIAVNGLVWACADQGVLTCMDAVTGEVHYSERLPSGQGYTASPVSDGRHLYFASETGNVSVVPAVSSFSVVATNALGTTCMATPAIADGSLLFRTRDGLLAIASP